MTTDTADRMVADIARLIGATHEAPPARYALTKPGAWHTVPLEAQTLEAAEAELAHYEEIRADMIRRGVLTERVAHWVLVTL